MITAGELINELRKVASDAQVVIVVRGSEKDYRALVTSVDVGLQQKTDKPTVWIFGKGD